LRVNRRFCGSKRATAMTTAGRTAADFAAARPLTAGREGRRRAGGQRSHRRQTTRWGRILTREPQHPEPCRLRQQSSRLEICPSAAAAADWSPPGRLEGAPADLDTAASDTKQRALQPAEPRRHLGNISSADACGAAAWLAALVPLSCQLRTGASVAQRAAATHHPHPARAGRLRLKAVNKQSRS